jgi:hypothetical protein
MKKSTVLMNVIAAQEVIDNSGILQDNSGVWVLEGTNCNWVFLAKVQKPNRALRGALRTDSPTYNMSTDKYRNTRYIWMENGDKLRRATEREIGYFEGLMARYNK